MKKKGKNCLKNATGEPQFLNMAKKKVKECAWQIALLENAKK